MSSTAPPPLEASGTISGGLVGRVEGQATLGPPPRPPWWKDKAKLKAEGWAFLHGIARVAVVKGVWELAQLPFSRRRVREA